ncbi:MAG: RNA 2',3'-cyclic phosphodiesterase [Candidatus Thermoplasmatota archaeon]|jgi:2'-5' RNA ligase|nr:RNA 2',3'-cyclic phosphodiesterase [Candidatus Thermoplasmatota archaeon]
MKEMRAFIAIKVTPNDDIRVILKTLKTMGKTVQPENIHLTLKFLGEIRETQEIVENLKKIELEKFVLEMSGIGAFPSLRKGRVVFINAGPEEKLIELARKVDSATPSITTDHPFSPHVTLLRSKVTQDFSSFAERVGNRIVQKQQVGHFSLYESQLTASGPIYTELIRFDLI